MTRQDAQASNAVITGILPVCSFDAHVLFDPGSTHSYVLTLFAKYFTKELIKLERPFLVSTSMGETLLVELGYRSYGVSVEEIDTVVDLMLLDMTNFDVILGMDWLASRQATLDYHSKAIKFCIPGEHAFMFQGDRSEVPYNMISIMSVRRMLRKGFHGFLSFVRDIKNEELSLEKVPVASEFPSVFSEELLGLPLDGDIEFNIELFPGTTNLHSSLL